MIAWLLILEALLLFVGYHGDFYSKNRHVLVPLMQMRLSAWLVTFIVADFVFVDFSTQFLYNDINNYIGKPAKSSKPA